MSKEDNKEQTEAFCKFPDHTEVKLDSYQDLNAYVKMSRGPTNSLYKDTTKIVWTNDMGRVETMHVPSEWIVFKPKN